MPLKKIHHYISALKQNAPELVALTLSEEITGLNIKTINKILSALQHNAHLTSLELVGLDSGRTDPNEYSRSSKQSLSCKFADNKRNTTLTSLLLYSIFNNSDEDVKFFAERVLPHFPNLTHLSFQNNDIGSEAMRVLVLALKELKHLTHLDISGSMLGSNADSIFKHLPNSTIRHLRLQSAGLELSEIKALNEALRRTTSLRTLDLFLNVSSMQIGALRIENCPLASLNLSFCGIDDTHTDLFDQIENNKSLIELNLNRNMFEGVSRNFLTMLKWGHFRMLDLSDNVLGSSLVSVFNAMSYNKNLRILNLRNIRISNPAQANKIFSLIRIDETLTSLDLSENSFGKYARSIIHQGLRIHPSLGSIKLRENDIDDSAEDHIRGLLQHNRPLKAIDLSYNKFSADIAMKIALYAILRAPSLRSISLRGYHLGTQCDKDKMTSLASMLVDAYHSLTGTDLNKKKFDTKEEIALLANALAVSQTLTHIDLGDNEFDADAITAICQALKENRSIASINLSHSHLSSQAITALIELLNTNTSITSLDLSECLFDIDNSDDLKKLSAAIPSSKLAYLNLSQLHLSSSSDASIGKSLPHLMAINNQIACNRECYCKAFPLHAAIKFLQGAEREVEIEILLQQPNVNLLSDDSGKDILEHPEAIELTPEIKEKLEEKYKEQYTEAYPLHAAIKFLSGETEITKLFDSGRTLPSIDDKGCSVMDLAKEQPQEGDNLVNLLELHMELQDSIARAPIELQDSIAQAPLTAAMERFDIRQRQRQQSSNDDTAEQSESTMRRRSPSPSGH